MLLAADVGGTKTLLGLFRRTAGRPISLAVHSYPTSAFRSFAGMIDAFETDLRQSLAVDAVAAGVAGPVVNQRARLTNIAWDISATEIATRCRTDRVRLLNDVEAMAASVTVLEDDEVAVLQEGVARDNGNAVVIAAGTGLGQAYLYRVNGRLEPVASEGGHADFAPRTDREIELVRRLRLTYGRAEVEHVVSGPGLTNLFHFTHTPGSCLSLSEAEPDPAAISRAALDGRCPACEEALALFVSAYGSEAGNLALRGVATAGVFVGGGIAPRILPALQRGAFIEAFRGKPPMSDLLARMPVKVILNPEAALLGAAVVANSL